MQRRPEVIELVPQQRDTVTIPSCFLPSSQTGSLWKTSAQQRKATQYERTSNAVLQCTPPPNQGAKAKILMHRPFPSSSWFFFVTFKAVLIVLPQT